MPGVIAGAYRCGESLTMRVSARQATEIGAFADTGAGNEKGHGVLLGTALRRGLLRECQVRA